MFKVEKRGIAGSHPKQALAAPQYRETI